jgi:ATP-dependent Lhr-like helicase
VLRRLRRRSLAALRKEVEPVEPATLGRFLPAWQHVGSRLRGVDGVLTVIEQLAGCAVPASALEPLVLGTRVVDYSPAMLDELTAGGEVLWAGHGTLPGTDGWVSLHLADSAHLTLPDPAELETTPLHEAILDALGGGGAFFFRQLADLAQAQSGLSDAAAMQAALWDLVWAGRLAGDTLAPLRALTSTGRTSHRSTGARRTPPRVRSAGRRRPPGPGRGPSRTGPPTVAGRWALLPEVESDPTLRAHASAEGLLERHGIVTRGAVTSERVPGGFAGVYKVLAAFEDSGRCRRGYFVASLGAAQFGGSGAVDRLRSYSREPGAEPGGKPTALALAATDPANPYGAALPWPERVVDEAETGTKSTHRPGRKAGALVVLVDGELGLYVERGGRTLLTFTHDPELLRPATEALASAVRQGALGRLTVERADGEHILGLGERSSGLRQALEAAGFVATPKGLRIRA